MSCANYPGNPAPTKVAIITGASRGIGAGLVTAFRTAGYAVLATARSIGPADDPEVATVSGDISEAQTAQRVIACALGRFGRIDSLVNNAGVFIGKPFTDYTAEEFHAFVSTNLEGFIFITQLAVRQMLSQGTGGSVTSITASLADSPIAGIPASIPMITKGGLDAVILSLASEYAKKNIRFNAVAPGVVDTPLHGNNPEPRSAMGTISEPADIAEAVIYLTEAGHVTGEVLHVDDGAHVGRW